jgi:hypothetical protein
MTVFGMSISSGVGGDAVFENETPRLSVWLQARPRPPCDIASSKNRDRVARHGEAPRRSTALRRDPRKAAMNGKQRGRRYQLRQ